MLRTFSVPWSGFTPLIIALLIGDLAARDTSSLPPNLGGGLRELVASPLQAGPTARRQPAGASASVPVANTRVQGDGAGRVVVDVYLSPGADVSTVATLLVSLGATLLAQESAGHSLAARDGVLTVLLPAKSAATASGLPGVRSIMLVHRPWRRAGSVTSQGVVAIKSNLALKRQITGAGITVGVISDSYDVTQPHAAVDVRRDDLPGLGNPAQRTTPVIVLAEGNLSEGDNDEGRAMLQIVHDVAPGAALAFHAVGESQATFANAIRNLRTNQRAQCDVIVDDIAFPDEPFFSDGIVAKAVDDVVNSTTLAGKKAIYYSAAGNQADLGYEAAFSPVSDFAARNNQLANQHLFLDQVPQELTAGGFHNFGTANDVQIAQTIKVSGDIAEISLQWNDLFDPAEMTADYNLLVFDEQGNYRADFSGTDHNFDTGLADEIIDLVPHDDGSPRTYRIAISKRAVGTGEATHLRYIIDTNGIVDGDFLQQRVPTVFGHPGARSADGIGAYKFSRLVEPEQFSSYGPVTIYFDDQGNRLATPEVRQQPTLSGPDGVATSEPGFRPFFGTSAAAPHVAGVAALLLQAQGGPGSLDAAAMRAALQSTARTHDLDPFSATAHLQSDVGEITLTGRGDTTDLSSFDPGFFHLQFAGPTGSTLKNITIDLSPAGLRFDGSAANGFPFKVAGTSGGVTGSVTPIVGTGIRGTPKSLLVLKFAHFPTGGSIDFGIDRDLATTHHEGNSADILARGIVTASVLSDPSAAKPSVVKGFFLNETGRGYSPADGFGLVDADAALRALGH